MSSRHSFNVPLFLMKGTTACRKPLTISFSRYVAESSPSLGPVRLWCIPGSILRLYCCRALAMASVRLAYLVHSPRSAGPLYRASPEIRTTSRLLSTRSLLDHDLLPMHTGPQTLPSQDPIPSDRSFLILATRSSAEPHLIGPVDVQYRRVRRGAAARKFAWLEASYCG